MPQNPAALAVVLNEDQSEVLLIKRRDLPLWVLPGGGVEDGEAPVDAAVREVLEESGYCVESERCVAQYTPSFPGSADTHVFRCRVLSGTATLSDESEAVDWFPLNRLPRPFFELHSYCLQQALHGRDIARTPLKLWNFPRLIPWAIRHPILVLRFFLGKKTRRP